MIGKKGQRRGLFGRGADSDPQANAFSLECPICGRETEGNRVEHYQSIPCAGCGYVAFVLPISPLPTQRRPRKPKEKPPARPAPSSEREPSAAVERSKSETSKPRTERPTRVPASADAKPAPRQPTVESDPLPRPRFWTKLRLVAFAVCSIVLLTVGWNLWQRHLQNLREGFRPAAQRGMQALQAGDLRAARDELQYAVNALDRLGESVADGPRWRQALAELRHVDQLLYSPPEREYSGLLAEARDDQIPVEKRWLVLDAVVEPRVGGWSIHYQPWIDDRMVLFHPDGLKLFEELAINEPRRLIFAAQADSLYREDGQWYFRLRPDSGALLTEEAIFADLGLSKDPEIEPLRLQQRRLVEERWEAAK